MNTLVAVLVPHLFGNSGGGGGASAAAASAVVVAMVRMVVWFVRE
jgi:formiminotetrahydrofolate cyclodeaminase